jgi:dephospho-CoA kinase
MNRLVVLCGHVGSGKSTLAKEFIKNHSSYTFFDVFEHIIKYKDKTGFISRELSGRAYSEFYQRVSDHFGDVLVEIGVNHWEENIEWLSSLKGKYLAHIFFCLLDQEVCRERVINRGNLDKTRIIDPKMLEDKFKVDFPRIHECLSKKYSIAYLSLNMASPIEQNISLIDNAI